MDELLQYLQGQAAVLSPSADRFLRPLPAMKSVPDAAFLSWDYVVKEYAPDEKQMSVVGILSTQIPDRSRDVVHAKGMDCTNHAKNPIVCYEHNRYRPIALAADPSTGEYTVKCHDDRVEIKSFFFQSDLVSEQIFDMVVKKMIRGLSPGFLTRAGQVERVPVDPNNVYGPAHYHVKACELVEASFTTLPDNPDALVVAYQKGLGGKPLHDVIKKSLEAVLPGAKAWSPGFTPPTPGSNGVHPPPTPTPTPTPGVAPQVIVKHVPAMPTEPRYVGPTGAQAVARHFDMLAIHAAMLVKSLADQDNPEVVTYLRERVQAADQEMQEVAAKFKALYPGQPELVPADFTAADLNDDTAGSDAVKKAVARIKKLADYVRHAPTGLKKVTQKAITLLEELGTQGTQVNDEYRAKAATLSAELGRDLGTPTYDTDDQMKGQLETICKTVESLSSTVVKLNTKVNQALMGRRVPDAV